MEDSPHGTDKTWSAGDDRKRNRESEMFVRDKPSDFSGAPEDSGDRRGENAVGVDIDRNLFEITIQTITKHIYPRTQHNSAKMGEDVV